MLQKYRGDTICQVFVIDQSRQSEEWLKQVPGVDRVLTFPVDRKQMALLGHDHPSSLNEALASTEIETSHILILDSDCFPVGHNWLHFSSEVTLASDPHYWSLSHPCFMFFPTVVGRRLNFSEGISEIGIDTGRLVGVQISRLGMEVSFSRPAPAFRGYRGHWYQAGHLYHHGSASFVSSLDHRVLRQVDPWREDLFRRYVAQGRYELSRRDFLTMRARGVLGRLNKKAKA